MVKDPALYELQFANTEIERQLVGSILYNPKLLEELIIEPEYIYNNQLKEILKICKELDSFGKSIGVMEVLEAALATNTVENIGGTTLIRELKDEIFTTNRFMHFQEVVIDYYKKRESYKIANYLMKQIANGDYKEAHRKSVLALSSLDDIGHIEESDGHISKAVVRVNEKAINGEGNADSTPTGFKTLDKYLNGFKRQELVIVGARSSVGKTTFVQNLIEQYSIESKHKQPTLFFSIEVPDEAVVKKILSSQTKIQQSKIQKPDNMTVKEWEKYSIASGIIAESNIYIKDNPSADLEYIEREIRKLKKKFENEHLLIVIDYIQIIKGNENLIANQNARMTLIIDKLKEFARRYDCTVLGLSQLSRGLMNRQDKRPMKSDLKDSGSIEATADCIMLLYREDYHDREIQNGDMIEIIIDKNRNGPLATVEMKFYKEISKFVELA